MFKLLFTLIIFGSQSFAAQSNFEFCKSQLKNNTPCEILAGKKTPKAAREWIKNLKKNELKSFQEIEEFKKEINLKTSSLEELRKELDVANAQVLYRMEEYKGLKTKFDNISGQLTNQIDVNTRLKKTYDDLVKKHRKFTSEFNIQNRITIVLGILFVLALFLLIKKAKEWYGAKKEIAVLRAKLKEFSISPAEQEEFPLPQNSPHKETHIPTPQ
jgi:uncharacterized protein YdaT